MQSLPPRKIKSVCGWVFVNIRTGKRLTTRAASTAFERVCAFSAVPLFYSHSVRHTLVTDLDDLGINTKTIATITGHASEKMINTHYLNRRVAKAKKAASRLHAHRWEQVRQRNLDTAINNLFSPARLAAIGAAENNLP